MVQSTPIARIGNQLYTPSAPSSEFASALTAIGIVGFMTFLGMAIVVSFLP